MFRTALRNVLAHRSRLLMTVLSVMLGVAFASGTLVFGDTVSSAYRHAMSTDLAGVDLALTAGPTAPPGASGPDQNLLRQASHLPGVASARGTVSGFAAVAGRDGHLVASTGSSLGANYAPGPDGTDPDHPLTAGRAPARAGEIALDQGTADRAGLHPGDTVRLSVNGPVRTEKLVGTFTSKDPQVTAGGSLTLFDTATAQNLYATPGHYSRIVLTAAEGTGQDQLADTVHRILPTDGSVTATTGSDLAAQQAATINSNTRTLTGALLGFSAIALFVSVFVIANTFTMLIGQRTRELALLRAVGATRRQVVRAVRTEALLVGAASAAAGCLLGVGIAAAVRTVLAAAGTDLPAGPLVVTPATVVGSLAIGVLVTLFASWLPARRTAKIPPVAALRSADTPPAQRTLVLRGAVGVVLAALGAWLIHSGISTGGGVGMKTTVLGVPFVLGSLIAAAPVLARPLAAAAAPLLERGFGTVGRLARINAARNPRRTGATAAALAIGVTLVTGLTVLSGSMNAAIGQRATDGLKADYQVNLAMPGSLAPSVAATLAAQPGVTAAGALQSSHLTVDGTTVSATGADPATVERVLDLKAVSGSLTDLASPSTVLVSQDAAQEHGWSVGSTIPAAFADGAHATLRVGAVIEPNRFVMDLLLPTATLRAHGATEDATVLVTTDHGGDSATTDRLVHALGDNPALDIKDQAQLRAENSGQLGSLVNTLYGLLGMSVLIAALGVANTLILSVHERTREIGLLRAVGLSRGGLRRMVRLEAVVVSLLGTAVGLVAGGVIAWSICATAGMGLSLPVTGLPLIAAAAIALGLLAAAWPARRAGRLNLLDALDRR
ncbi:ABC transporter permease [Kitasatospora sp. NPDC101176]|uniref:ABC transporter permease n=1 Tax=Kitasatospora sp. NPDC101176 TaxID=3364099 RepID=UPI00381F9836